MRVKKATDGFEERSEELMQAAGFVDIQVTATGFYGWRGRGIRPRDV